MFCRVFWYMMYRKGFFWLFFSFVYIGGIPLMHYFTKFIIYFKEYQLGNTVQNLCCNNNHDFTGQEKVPSFHVILSLFVSSFLSFITSFLSFFLSFLFFSFFPAHCSLDSLLSKTGTFSAITFLSFIWTYVEVCIVYVLELLWLQVALPEEFSGAMCSEKSNGLQLGPLKNFVCLHLTIGSY